MLLYSSGGTYRDARNLAAVRRCWPALLIVIHVLSGCLMMTTASLIDSRNVVLILADDGGFEMGVYGNSRCQTPHLDQLGKKSLAFSQARTSVSSCSPSRASLLTGLPSHQNGMYGLHHDVHHYDSYQTVQTLPKILRDHGIRTGIVGKKHVGPPAAYAFDYEATEENHSILQVGRNITKIKLLVSEFLQKNRTRPFMLYVAFHDPHRCDHSSPQYGHFCEKFGNGEAGMGRIPDWEPIYYRPDQVIVPHFVPDTSAARIDIAAQYTTISRFDQGVGLVLDEIRKANQEETTLIIYSSDNGISFPNGRTNSYESGLAVPLLISSPFHRKRRGEMTHVPASLLDIVPTVLDWFNLTYPVYHILKPTQPTRILGQSLLPLLDQDAAGMNDRPSYSSHVTHEVTMNYPMRSIRSGTLKLIHNLNYRMPFPIDQDFYLSPTFLDLLNRTVHKEPLFWSKTLSNYYAREEWELFDLELDPEELSNVSHKKTYKGKLKELKNALKQWQRKTYDPWLCSPHGVLLDVGAHAGNPICAPLYNRIN